MKKKWIHDNASNSDDSTSGSDNSDTMLQHNNKGRIAVRGDEEEDIIHMVQG